MPIPPPDMSVSKSPTESTAEPALLLDGQANNAAKNVKTKKEEMGSNGRPWKREMREKDVVQRRGLSNVRHGAISKVDSCPES